MPIDKKILEKYIGDHQSSYQGKYKFLSGYRVSEYSAKMHYYMLDENFRKIDIFVDLYYENDVKATFSENLNEQEKQYIINDSLKQILENDPYPRLLHYSLYESYLNAEHPFEFYMSPIDYINVFSYMKYHRGINQQTVDDFYKIFIPALINLRENHRYDAYLETILLLLKNILREYEWDSPNAKYLDTEYQYHLYYIRKIIKMVCECIGEFHQYASKRLVEVISLLCQSPRFTFAIMTDFGALVLSEPKVINDLIVELKKRFTLFTIEDEHNPDVNLVFSYLYYIHKNDVENYEGVIKSMFRHIMSNMLTLADSDLDLALGNVLLKANGYGVLLDLFHTDYNTFIFSCFPISSFPEELRPEVRKELVAAIMFFAGRMENEKYRQSSFEQIVNINRLLLYNFGEWYR